MTKIPLSRLCRPSRLVALVACASAAAAQAHTGHGTESLAAGLAHPFTGLDHLLAMVAVGLWSAVALPAGRRAFGPLAFVGAMLAGALLAVGGNGLPWVEPGIAASVVLLGAMLLVRERLGSTSGLLLVASSGLLHGHAHGAEFALGTSFAAYACGFVIATALLHGVGLAAGQRLAQAQAWAWRTLGALVGLAGLGLIATRF